MFSLSSSKKKEEQTKQRKKNKKKKKQQIFFFPLPSFNLVFVADFTTDEDSTAQTAAEDWEEITNTAGVIFNGGLLLGKLAWSQEAGEEKNFDIIKAGEESRVPLSRHF